jgi:hypothetical protein
MELSCVGAKGASRVGAIALTHVGADLSRRTAGRPGVSRSEAIRGMPSSGRDESRRRLRGSSEGPSVQRQPVAVRVLSGVPRASRPAVAASSLWRGLAVALRAEAEARYPTPGLRSRMTATKRKCGANELMHARTFDPAIDLSRVGASRLTLVRASPLTPVGASSLTLFPAPCGVVLRRRPARQTHGRVEFSLPPVPQWPRCVVGQVKPSGCRVLLELSLAKVERTG